MYHYVGCGLRDVWLVNGYRIKETPYGETVAIENVGGLHKAIGDWIIHNSNRLTGPQFRYLRKEQELSQKVLGEILGVDEQSVARWEKGKIRVPKPIDHLMRVLYQQCIHDDGSLKEIIARINSLEERHHKALNMSVNHSKWQPTQIAA
jgi:putative transcriptional regulator